jgi:hypothetical protein
MARPTLEFLCDSIAVALLSHYDIKRIPVPVREMLLDPPPDLRLDLSLTEVRFGEATWLRMIGGQGSVFANGDLPEPERRYHMACSLFTAFCATQGGRAAGLPEMPNDDMKAQKDFFARRLLLAPELLPAGWQTMAPKALADLAGVPLEVAEAHLANAAR